MVKYRSKRLSAAANAPVDLSNFFARSLRWGGRGALFTGNSADAVEKQSPNVTRAAFGVSLKASNMPAGDEIVAAANDHNDAFLTSLCHHERYVARLGEIDFVIIGCSGFGSQIAIQLADLGARHFLLMDADCIDGNNLKHLPWASEDDLGWLKTDKLSSYLAARFSADVFALPEFTEGAAALRLIADYAQNPFIVLAGDDPRPAKEFLTACRASAAGLPPHLHGYRFGACCVGSPSAAQLEGAFPMCRCAVPAAADDHSLAPEPSTDNASIARLAVSKIARECLPDHSILRGRKWILDLNSDRDRHHSLPNGSDVRGRFVATRGTDMDHIETPAAILPALHAAGDYVGETAGRTYELTISEALRDPLIAIMMRADGVTSEEFRRLLETAARELETNTANSVIGGEMEQAKGTPTPSHQWEDGRHVCRDGAEDG